MKIIKCETCGSTQLIEQEDFYKCQYCRTKYSKTATTDTINTKEDNSETDTINTKEDNSEELAKLYQLARRARADNNVERAFRYYDSILDEEPGCWEATFYTAYFEAIKYYSINIPGALNSIKNCLSSTLRLIKNNIDDAIEQEAAVKEVVIRVTGTCESSITITEEQQEDSITTKRAAVSTIYHLGNLLESTFEGEKYACDLAVALWKTGVQTQISLSFADFNNKNSHRKEALLYAEKIKKHDASYLIPNYLKGSTIWVNLILLSIAAIILLAVYFTR